MQKPRQREAADVGPCFGIGSGSKEPLAITANAVRGGRPAFEAHCGVEIVPICRSTRINRIPRQSSSRRRVHCIRTNKRGEAAPSPAEAATPALRMCTRSMSVGSKAVSGTRGPEAPPSQQAPVPSKGIQLCSCNAKGPSKPAVALGRADDQAMQSIKFRATYKTM